MNLYIAHPMPGRPLPTAALFIITLLLQSAVFADSYKWTDGSGEVHYTQTPPPNGIAAQTIEGAPPPPESAGVTRDAQPQVDATEEGRAGQEEQQIIQQRTELAILDQENCNTAQGNLAKLQRGGINRYLTPEGEVVRLTEEDRRQRISQAQEQIEKYCNH
jgi:hypothetical protein